MAGLAGTAVAQSSERYDRQLRIWGDGGQARLRDAKILILGSSATTAEALRNLVLPGIGSFALIDDTKVLLSDLSENFLVLPEDVGDFRCRAVSKRALELNPAVSGEAWALSPHEYLVHHAHPSQKDSEGRRTALKFSFSASRVESDRCYPPPLCAFDLVICTLMCTDDERQLLSICSECSLPRSRPSGERSDGYGLTAPLKETLFERWRLSRQVPVVFVGSLGFFGWVRLWAGEYCLVDTKPENSVVDLRIANPFPELLEFASRFDLEAMDDEQHSHVPFIVILIQALCRFRGLTLEEMSVAASKGIPEDTFLSSLPNDARKEIYDIVVKMRRSEQEANFQEALNNVYRAVAPASHCDDVAEIMERGSKMADPPTPFWRLARALQKMFVSQKALPVCRLTMDMTADTSSYVALQRIYAEKAARDEQTLRGFMSDDHPDAMDKGHNSLPIPVSPDELQCFCKNAASIKVIRYPEATENTFGIASLRLLVAAAKQLSLCSSDSCSVSDTEESGRHHIPWYTTILACKLAADKMGRFPGATAAVGPHPLGQSVATTSEISAHRERQLSDDTAAVRAEVQNIEKAVGLGLLVTDDIIKQVVGYRGTEFPTTAALIGGVAAQESIKLLCKQFEPLNNTFLWNGTERRGIMMEL